MEKQNNDLQGECEILSNELHRKSDQALNLEA